MISAEELHFRNATSEDIVAITDIYNQAVRKRNSTADLVERTLEQRREWVDSHEPRHRYPVVVAEYHHRVIAFGSLSQFHPRQAYNGIVELSYYVDDSFQHQGVGSAVLRYLMELSRLTEARIVTALILGSNTPSIALVKKFGFERYGFLPKACDMGDRVVDMTYWYRSLQSE